MSIDTTVDLDTPPLREGDRLTADEFHRRYAAMPHVRNANLVDGVVYMSSPVFTQHGGPQYDIIGWLAMFSFGLRGVEGLDNTSWRIDDENEVQADVALYFDADHGGAVVDDGRFIRGVPDLVVEVAVSSARLDAGAKRALYERAGVREYILWRVREERIDWWERGADGFQELPADEAGVVRSREFPGLWLDVPAMVGDDMARVKATLDAGLASPEHKAFAARLA